MSTRALLPLILLVTCFSVRADGMGDNLPEKVRPIPPPGITLTDADRAELQSGVDRLGREIDALRTALQARPELLEMLPDVQIFHRAVHPP